MSTNAGVILIVALLVAGALLAARAGIRSIQSARKVSFFRMRRAQMITGWKWLLLALFLFSFSVASALVGEPLANQLFPRGAGATASPTQTPLATATFFLPATSTVTPTPTPTAMPEFTLTPNPTQTSSATLTPSLTPTRTATATSTPTLTASQTQTATATALTLTATSTASPAPTATVSRTPSRTPTPTQNKGATSTAAARASQAERTVAALSHTPTPRKTDTTTSSPAPTGTMSRTPTFTPSATATATPSRTATLTLTQTPVWTATLEPTHTPSPTITLTSTPTLTATQTASLTPSSTLTPSPSPTGTPTPTSSPTSTSSPTWTPALTSTFTPIPTSTPTPVPSATSTVTATATISQTAAPTATATLTPSATATMSQTPTATTTPSYTSTPTFTPSQTPTRTPTQTATGTVTRTPTPNRGCDRIEFVADVTVPRNSVFAPGATFTKVWKLKNAGTCIWKTTYRVVLVGGDRMGAQNLMPLPTAVGSGQTIDLSMIFTAPALEGTYQADWQIRNEKGEIFGTTAAANRPFSLLIRVKASPPTGTVYDFVANACSAQWSSAAGTLNCRGANLRSNGYVLKQSLAKPENGANVAKPSLLTAPQSTLHGYIRALYPSFRVQKGDRFQASVGCEVGAASCSVLFRLDYQLADGTVRELWSVEEHYERNLSTVDLDLSVLEGQDVNFVLTILSLGPASDNRALWIEPRIVRSSTAESVTSTPTP